MAAYEPPAPLPPPRPQAEPVREAYIVQAASAVEAGSAVARVGGKMTGDLSVIRAVSALLADEELAALRAAEVPELEVYSDSKVTASAVRGTSGRSSDSNPASASPRQAPKRRRLPRALRVPFRRPTRASAPGSYRSGRHRRGPHAFWQRRWPSSAQPADSCY